MKKQLLWSFIKKCSKKKLKRKALLHLQKTHPKLQHYFAKYNSYMYCLLYDVIFCCCLPEIFITVPTLVSVFQRKNYIILKYDTEIKYWNVGLCNIWYLVEIISKTTSKVTSLACSRRELTTAFLCWHIPIFAVAVLQDMECYLIVNFKT